MEIFAGLVLTIFGLFVFIHVFTMIVLTSRMVKLQFWEPVSEEVERDGTIEELPVLDAARPIMEQEGFQYVRTRRMRPIVATASPHPMHADVYYHPGHDVHAEVVTASMPTPQFPFDVYLWNTYVDGSVLLTVNGLAHCLVTYPGSYTIVDPYAPTIALQLAAHLARRANLYGERSAPGDNSVMDAMAHSMLSDMERDGAVYRRGERDGEPVYGMRLMRAVTVAWGLRVGAGRRKQMELAIAKDPSIVPAAPEVRDTAERIAFVQGLCSLHGMQAPRWFRWLAFAVSAAAFIGFGTWLWGIAGALVIAAVVALHEAGHWLAMRLAGFRDVQVFFVPGMGAATSGEKHDASPLTHLAVYLAGPVPGLVLAIGALAWVVMGQGGQPPSGTLTMAIVAALLINFLNLVPVLPLDGGRIVDLFVMGRLPWFRFGFACISGVLLLGAGMATGDYVLLGLGMLSFLGMFHQYRLAKISRDLLRQPVAAPLASDGFAGAAEKLHDFFAQPAYKDWSFELKMSLAHSILPRFLGRLPNVKETSIGIAIYLACIVTPVVAVAGLLTHSPALMERPSWSALLPESSADTKDEKRASRARSDARLAAAASPAERIEVLTQLVDEADDAYDQPETLRLAEQLFEATAALPAPSWQHADAAFKLASALDDSEEDENGARAYGLRKDAERVLRLRLAGQDDSRDALLLARVLNAGPSTPQVLQEIVDLYSAHPEQAKSHLPEARTALARGLDGAGRQAEAEQQLIAARTDAERLSLTMEYARQQLALNHAWFLMHHQRPQDALQRLSDNFAKPVDASAGWYSPERDTYMLATVMARARGDWQEVQRITSTLLKVKSYQPAGRFERFMFGKPAAPQFRFDIRAGLLLVEAERKLGRGEAADKLVAAMRKQEEKQEGKKEGAPVCKYGRERDAWRQALGDAITESEKREFGCEDPPVPLACPVPAPIPGTESESDDTP